MFALFFSHLNKRCPETTFYQTVTGHRLLREAKSSVITAAISALYCNLITPQSYHWPSHTLIKRYTVIILIKTWAISKTFTWEKRFPMLEKHLFVLKVQNCEAVHLQESKAQLHSSYRTDKWIVIKIAVLVLFQHAWGEGRSTFLKMAYILHIGQLSRTTSNSFSLASDGKALLLSNLTWIM